MRRHPPYINCTTTEEYLGTPHLSSLHSGEECRDYDKNREQTIAKVECLTSNHNLNRFIWHLVRMRHCCAKQRVLKKKLQFVHTKWTMIDKKTWSRVRWPIVWQNSGARDKVLLSSNSMPLGYKNHVKVLFSRLDDIEPNPPYLYCSPMKP